MGVRIEVWISDELAAELDGARGSMARGRWIGELIAAELHGEPVPSGPPPTPDWSGLKPPGFPVSSVVHPGGWCVHPLVFVDDPVEETIPLTPEGKARSAAIWAEVAERLAAERDPGPDLP